MQYRILFFVGLLLVPRTSLAATMKLTTYYPAPQGTYDRLRLISREDLPEPCAAGTIYLNHGGHLQYCNSNPGEGHWSNVATHVERGSATLTDSGPYPITFNVPFSDLPLIQIYAEVEIINDKGSRKSIMNYTSGVGIFDISPIGFTIDFSESSSKELKIYWIANGY